MTLEGARSTARGMAVRFGGAYVVYRFPAWTPGVWGVLKERELPLNVIIDSRQTDEPLPVVAHEPEQGALF